jgi:IS5 family transposase
MLKPSNGQGHLFDAENLVPNLFDPDSFAMRLKTLADELFSDAQFADMYADVGRPARSPKIMTVALILQQKLNLSDRQMEQASRFHLEVKASLGLPLDHPGIAKTCYSEFRARLLQHGRECDAFNAVNRMLLDKGLIDKREAMIIDASHLEADAATPNPRLLIRKATRQILRQLDKERPDLYKQLTEQISLRKDTDFSGGRDYYLLPEAERNERFAKAAGEARTVITTLRPKKLSPALKGHLDLLAAILEERSTDDDEPIDPENAPTGRITSHRDRDARWGAKGKDKFFHGFKRTVLTTKTHGFIANFGINPGNDTDGPVLPAILDDTKELLGSMPPKVIGDAAYGSVENYRQGAERGVQVVASIKPAPNPRGKWSRDRFTYDAETKTLTCPEGQATQEAFVAPDGEGLVYRFAANQCGRCPSRELCCSGDFRSVKVAETVPGLDEALAYARTEAYSEDMKARPPKESIHADLVKNHGGRRTRYVGIDRVLAGEALRCLVVNLKRLFKLPEGLWSNPMAGAALA